MCSEHGQLAGPIFARLFVVARWGARRRRGRRRGGPWRAGAGGCTWRMALIDPPLTRDSSSTARRRPAAAGLVHLLSRRVCGGGCQYCSQKRRVRRPACVVRPARTYALPATAGSVQRSQLYTCAALTARMPAHGMAACSCQLFFLLGDGALAPAPTRFFYSASQELFVLVVAYLLDFPKHLFIYLVFSSFSISVSFLYFFFSFFVRQLPRWSLAPASARGTWAPRSPTRTSTMSGWYQQPKKKKKKKERRGKKEGERREQSLSVVSATSYTACNKTKKKEAEKKHFADELLPDRCLFV